MIDHKFFNASIINDNTEHYWIHFVADLKKIDWINYPNSTFYITEFGFKEGDLQIESYEDLLQKSKEVGEMGTVEIDQITLNSNFDNSLDLFIIPFLTPKVFISLRLKQALEKDTTGIEINEAQIVLL